MEGTVTIPVDEYNRMRDLIEANKQDVKNQHKWNTEVLTKLNKIGVKYKRVGDEIEFYHAGPGIIHP